jgi:FlaA1/EpsC-like NDP-sugar epimerase
VLARGGEVMVTKMQVVSIIELAQVMIEILAPHYDHDPDQVEIKLIGAKPGEKMYEELLSFEEMGRSIELKDMFVVLPAFRSLYQNIDYVYPEDTGQPVSRPYNSGDEVFISREEIKKFLFSHHLLPEGPINFGDKKEVAGVSAL